MEREQDPQERDFPVVTPGQKVAIQLRERRYYDTDENGNKTGQPHWIMSPPEVKTVRDSDACWNADWQEWSETRDDSMHTMSICPDCIDSWAMDYYISLVPNDTPVTNPGMEPA